MLLMGRQSQEIKIKASTNLGFENNYSFTKFIVTPNRDTSISAAQRQKNADLGKKVSCIKDQLKKLEMQKEKLKTEKDQFAEYEKRTEFFEKINEIVENRWDIENKSAVLIQSVFRGFCNRKKYIQKRIEIDRELTKKLLKEMQFYSNDCFNTILGHKVIYKQAATQIQKNYRRYKAECLLKISRLAIKQKIFHETQNISLIQRAFLSFTNRQEVQTRRFEWFKAKRLFELFKQQKARLITKFLRICIEKIHKEKAEHLRQQSILRRKALINSKQKPKFNRKSRMLSCFSAMLKPNTEYSLDNIPMIYQIIRPEKLQGRPLTSAEKTRLPTESSCNRRRTIVIKRNAPKLAVAETVKSPNFQEDDKKSIIKRKEINIISNYWQNTESSYNRVTSIEQPQTPEFMKTLAKSRKITWRFLKPTCSHENYKSQRINNSVKSTVFSTHSSRTPTPNFSSKRPRSLLLKS